LARFQETGSHWSLGAEERVIVRTLESTPRDATHWSVRSMAKATGITPTTIHRIWRAFSLQPHRTETFKLSKDPLFIEKVRDIVGLYLNPPEKAAVLCVDEKSQVQALDRTQPPSAMLDVRIRRVGDDGFGFRLASVGGCARYRRLLAQFGENLTH
jgi:hypothetical protein